MEIEDMSRTLVNGDLAYLSLATDERTKGLQPSECIEFTAGRDFWMMTGDQALIFVEKADVVHVDWREAEGRWRVIRYESSRPTPSSANFKSPIPKSLGGVAR